jgi:hypothetical protein
MRVAGQISLGQTLALHALREIAGCLVKSIAQALALVGLLNLLCGRAAGYRTSQQSQYRIYAKSIPQLAMHYTAHWCPRVMVFNVRRRPIEPNQANP